VLLAAAVSVTVGFTEVGGKEDDGEGCGWGKARAV